MSASPVVLVVDDAPQSLGALCASLEAEGYTVLVARDGESALARLDLATPDAILLDALMPGLSGFETCRRIKQDPALSHIPVIFMTGLSETPHIVEGFESGGVDYVVKPVRAQEVLVRLATHVRNARAVRLARAAVDVGGHGVLVLDAQGRVAWRSPQAAAWLREFHPEGLPPAWASDGPLEHHSAAADGRVLTVRHAGAVGLGERMLLLRVQAASDAAPTRLSTASLTPRETEVLSWIAKGKTNRDVGEILGMSPRTVNKHLEHVFEKLGVETRAAAAALASRELG
ncbi:response regulator [Rhizobacter sp. OV335]|uniref:response regulator n=1 Tax=Rhizobacter sp. OV335 TaxID=1500264 RepID=UPI000910D37C|nr:response regulator [Rhizobacter sp. OV335]SHM76316.1 two component transcriptional regulator, LuxR family [Rhizobacter sp. OV335]